LTQLLNELVDTLPHISHTIVRRPHVVTKRLEPSNIPLKLLLGCRDCRHQCVSSIGCALGIISLNRKSVFQIAQRIFDSSNVCAQRARSFRERGMLSLGLGYAPSKRFDRLAGLQEPTLGGHEALVRCPLLALEPQDSLTRFGLPPIE